MSKYILAVDQSTQGTKGLVFDEQGTLIARADRSHRQIINAKGWVEHNPTEIIENVVQVCDDVLKKAKVVPADVVAFGISNQRETSLMWNKVTGNPIYNAVVWQCARAVDICDRPEIAGKAEQIRRKTGMNLSPYFPAAKLTWLMENVPAAKKLAAKGQLACGTIDSWLIYNLTGHHKTDYSNASRTQLFNIADLKWDEELCELFSIPIESMPKVCMSDSNFGMTNVGGVLDHMVPICGVLGDSHGALFGQDCRKPGQIKATYGTGSSVMMNIGSEMKLSDRGLVTSLAWGMDGKVEYVFEGNLNYTGAVISWLKKEVKLIATDMEATEMAYAANPNDKTYFVPAFTGLSAPYWDSHATGLLTGITRTTGRDEIAKACLDCIAYQITDLTNLMGEDAGIPVSTLRVDGGPTSSKYLMQFQSDMANATVQVPELQELSGMGAAYAAGISVGIYDPNTIYNHVKRTEYMPQMAPEHRDARYQGWKEAVKQVLTHS
ncbi:MAG: glycerol kinase GlpK [Clostridia bacterium]|nr:glycerol kinase GlpK [Clostridia bacterium]